jgi:hypothetical protein
MTISRSAQNQFALIKYYVLAELYDELIELIHQGEFLILKANKLGLNSLSEDLENEIIPYTIRRKDWKRFIQYTTVDLNLRGLGEQLSERIILESLARNKQIDFAHYVIQQVIDPLVRAEARANLLGILENHNLSNDQHGYFLYILQKMLEEDLIEANMHETDLSFLSKAFTRVLESLGENGYEVIKPYVKKLSGNSGEEFDDFWLTLVKNLSTRYKTYQTLIWDAIKHIKSPSLRNQALFCLPTLLSSSAWNQAMAQIRELDMSVTSFAESFFVLATLLGEDHEIDIWTEFVKTFHHINDIDFHAINQKRLSVFCEFLTTEQVQELITSLQSNDSKLAIAINNLDKGVFEDVIKQVVEWIENHENPSMKLYWLLKLLNHTNVDHQKILSQSKSLALSTAFSFFQEEDASIFLKSLAHYTPQNVPLFLDLIAFSENTSPGVLEAIARQCQHKVILEHFILNIEKYIGDNNFLSGEAERFSFRRKVLLLLLYVSCRLKMPTSTHNIIENKLFNQEREEIYPVIIHLIEDGEFDAATKLTDYIHDTKHKFLIALHLLGRGINPKNIDVRTLLSFENLYSVFVDTTATDDLLTSSSLLCEHPANAKITKQKISSITENTTKTKTLLALAKQNLNYQQKQYSSSKIQYQTIEELCLSAVSFISSEQSLLYYVPEITGLLATEKTNHSIDEILEGIENIMASPVVPYHIKINASLQLFSVFKDKFKDEFNGNEIQQFSSAKKVRRFVEGLFTLSQKSEDSYLKSQLEQSWCLFFPVLVAILKEISSPVPLYALEHPWQANLAYEHLSIVTQLTRGHSFFRELAKLEENYLPKNLQSIVQSPWNVFLDYAKDNLQEDHAQIISFSNSYLKSNYNPVSPSDINNLSSQSMIGIAFICAKSNPSLLPLLFKKIPNSPLKDVIIARIILDGWVPEYYFDYLKPELNSTIQYPELASFLTTWIDTTTGSWLSINLDNTYHLEEIVMKHATKAWFYRDVESWIANVFLRFKIDRTTFASQVLSSIRQNGKEKGYQTFLIWLDRFTNPEYSNNQLPQTRQRIALAQDAIFQSRVIGTGENKELAESSGLSDMSRIIPYTFNKYKKWRSELSKRFERHKTVLEGFESTGIIVLMMYSMILLFFDLHIADSSNSSVEHYLDVPPSLPFWLLVFVFWIINSWLSYSILSLRAYKNKKLKPFYNFLFFLFSGIPIWGLFSFPAYTWISQEKADLFTAYACSSPTGFLKTDKYISVKGSLIRSGIKLWRRWGIWWAYLINIIVTFAMTYYFLDTYALLGFPYRELGIVLGLILHILVFINALMVFRYGNIKSERIGWKAWQRYLFAILWLLPIPGLSFAGLLFYALFFDFDDARNKTVIFKAFGNVGKLTRDRIWFELKENLETDFQKLHWFRGIRENQYHQAGEDTYIEEKIPSNFLLKLRVLTAAGGAAWLVRGLFRIGLALETIDIIVYSIFFISLGIALIGVLGFVIQYVIALIKKTSYLPEPPYFVYLYISQFAVFSGVTFSYGNELNNIEFMSLFGLVSVLFLGLKLIEIILDLFINTPQERKKASFEMLLWIFLLITMFSTAINLNKTNPVNPTGLLEALNTPETTTGMLELLFMTILPLFELGLIVGSYSRFISPFGWNNILNKNLPKRSRWVLAFVGITFLLPLGGIFIPLWVYLKKKYWVEIEKQL